MPGLLACLWTWAGLPLQGWDQVSQEYRAPAHPGSAVPRQACCFSGLLSHYRCPVLQAVMSTRTFLDTKISVQACQSGALFLQHCVGLFVLQSQLQRADCHFFKSNQESLAYIHPLASPTHIQLILLLHTVTCRYAHGLFPIPMPNAAVRISALLWFALIGEIAPPNFPSGSTTVSSHYHRAVLEQPCSIIRRADSSPPSTLLS